jgi:large subunit ribosomal protein LP0
MHDGSSHPSPGFLLLAAQLIVHCDNVGSNQFMQVRHTLRGQATVLMGKNTTIRKVLKDFVRDNEGHPSIALMDYIVGNTGFIFTNGDLTTIRDIVTGNKVPAPARVGAIAPIDVFVEPGPTGCDPGQTAWFQALNIPTKVRGRAVCVAPCVGAVRCCATLSLSQFRNALRAWSPCRRRDGLLRAVSRSTEVRLK